MIYYQPERVYATKLKQDMTRLLLEDFNSKVSRGKNLACTINVMKWTPYDRFCIIKFVY